MSIKHSPAVAHHQGATIHDLTSERASRATRSVPAAPQTSNPASTSRRYTGGGATAADRAAKVQALKSAIADGSYKPDPEAVARKLMERGIQ